jgi:hypothetical protein
MTAVAAASKEDAAAPKVDATTALSRVLKIVGAVVAPSTLLTGLLLYFGRIYATQTFLYFGVNYTVLDLTAADYLVRSVDGLVFPLIVVAGATLLVLWVHRRLGTLPGTARRIVPRVLLPAAVTVGVVLVSLAMIDVIEGGALFPYHPEARGIDFSIGVLLLTYAARLARLLVAERRSEPVPRRPTSVAVAQWGAVFVLVSIGLFWAAGGYAGTLAIARAKQVEAVLPSTPTTLLYSEKKLGLQGAGIHETACGPGVTYRFRYDGLKLLLRSGDQYLFLPVGWTPEHGTAILVPRGDTLRLEFILAGQAPSATC